SCYEGTAYLHPLTTVTGPIPRSEVIFRTIDKRTDAFSFSTTLIFPLHPDTHDRAEWNDIKHLFAPDAIMSNRVDVTGRLEGGKLHLEWKNEVGSGKCSLLAASAVT